MPAGDIRRLVVGCDGTWNEPEQLDDGKPAQTNVTKLVNALASAKGLQIAHYEEGVGAGAWETLPGGIYGYGLDKRVLGAYRFLRSRFADRGFTRDQNRIYLFGFSRGAYTARRLAGLLAHSGIPLKASDTELGWQIYQQRDTASAARLKSDGRFFDVPIEMLGVWDTVKATNDPDYHDAELSPNVVAGYHAMALDEQRKLFPVLRWNASSRAQQVWFSGVHSNVGGGYADTRLSDVALSWMVARAVRHGLQFKKSYIEANVREDATGRQHDSMTGVWKTFGPLVRPVQAGELIHPSVEKRMTSVSSYRPTNFPSRPSYWSSTG